MSPGELAAWAGAALWATVCICGAWLLATSTVLAASHLLRAAYDALHASSPGKSRRW